MQTRRNIAALSLLTSVLLGGLVAPLSHFAFMAFSDAYAEHDMPASHHHVAHTNGQSLDMDSHVEHFECPYAAFFLSQSSGVSSDTPSLTLSPSATCLTVALVSEPRAASVHSTSIRGPPGHSA